MAREFKRADRLSGQIQREMAELLQFHSRERLPGLVTVSDVNLTRDMGYADVFVSIMGAPEQCADAYRLIEMQLGYFRQMLSQRLHLRRVPELRLHLDNTAEEGAAIRELIFKARQRDNGES